MRKISRVCQSYKGGNHPFWVSKQQSVWDPTCKEGSICGGISSPSYCTRLCVAVQVPEALEKSSSPIQLHLTNCATGQQMFLCIPFREPAEAPKHEIWLESLVVWSTEPAGACEVESVVTCSTGGLVCKMKDLGFIKERSSIKPFCLKKDYMPHKGSEHSAFFLGHRLSFHYRYVPFNDSVSDLGF